MHEKRYERIIAFAGNPNVGKSSLFNELTGARQHTGNWTGKTVDVAYGEYRKKGKSYKIIDLPGTYSLLSRSPEEKIARECILSNDFDVCCVICDATSLERNLALVLQILEHCKNVIVALNLWDEVEKYSVNIDVERLSELLGVPVVKVSAKHKKGLDSLITAFGCDNFKGFSVRYDDNIEYAMTLMTDKMSRFEKLCVLGSDRIEELEFLHAREYLYGIGYYPEKCSEAVAGAVISKAQELCELTVTQSEKRIEYNRRIDKFMTGRFTALPMMLLLLFGILFITIIGANYPSKWLSMLFNCTEGYLDSFLASTGLPSTLCDMTVYGVFRITGWVISVMLPPMAIFFPLFTLLEDVGFLPRIAFNMDGCFRCANSCGKQSLTMCMGFGCNAVGVCGCRIIDSPRERLVAILTNVFVPCNGRFPTLITLISVFLVYRSGAGSSMVSALILSLCIIFGVAITLFVSGMLSKTLLKGYPSSFTLELPPYRMPNIGRVLVRSFLDRTVFVLGRAISVAAPAGALIWMLANVKLGNISLLASLSDFLDPFGRFFGLDGVILLGFILGFPANEIVLPIIVMCYSGAGVINECGDLTSLKALLVENGWNLIKCISVMVFCICHFPCSTTLLTVKKETGKWRWSIAAFIIPTLTGLCLCLVVRAISLLF